ncbi:MAG TPA: iron chelate uptake ABC transporter family permease subunit, partial [Chitinophagales bacterium]
SSLDKLLLGDEVAKVSGLNLQRTRALTIISAAVSAGVVTAFCGPIGFVGLAVPHIARMIFKTNLHRPLTIACFLLGAVVCGLCNALALSNLFGLMIPVNILTALFGSPFVIWLIYKQNQS